MLSLLLNDFYKMKPTLILALVTLIGYSFIFFNSTNFDVAPLSVMLSIFTFLNTLTADEKANFNLYARSLPISLNVFVGSKYVLCTTFPIIAGVVGLFIQIIIQGIFLGAELDLSWLLISVLNMIVVALLINLTLTPLCLKYGVEKASFVGLIVGVTMSTVLLANFQKSPFYSPFIIIILTIIIAIFSFYCSLKIVKTKHY